MPDRFYADAEHERVNRFDWDERWHEHDIDIPADGRIFVSNDGRYEAILHYDGQIVITDLASGDDITLWPHEMIRRLANLAMMDGFPGILDEESSKMGPPPEDIP